MSVNSHILDEVKQCRESDFHFTFTFNFVIILHIGEVNSIFMTAFF